MPHNTGDDVMKKPKPDYKSEVANLRRLLHGLLNTMRADERVTPDPKIEQEARELLYGA